ncbi:hypothetical protein [Streptomyces griseorubiginosus]|uniref:hypothetical protein n=1 Tax=Streptomyces griseorubiginosus TaxID=67304 RepID=UPI0036EA15B8
MDRHARSRLKNEFDERVRTETKQVPETEKRLRNTVAKLKKTIANQNKELEELRQTVTSLTLASAVLIQQQTPKPSTPHPVPPVADNVIPLRPPTSPSSS